MRSPIVAKISQAYVKSLAPCELDQWHWDATLKGFAIRQRPGKEPQFWVRYSVNGRKRKHLIGPCNVVKAEAAREKAREILEKAQLDVDYREELKALRDAPTVKDLADRSLEMSQGKNVDKVTRSKRGHWTRYIVPALGSKKVAELNRTDIERLFKSVPGKVAPNQVVKTLSKALSDCELFDPPWRPQRSNPCYRFEFKRQRPRDVTLSRDELIRLMNLIDAERLTPTISISFHHLLYQLLITGLRYSEWALRLWSDVDLDKGVLHIARTKSGRSRDVYLSESSIAELRSMPRLTKWIFPGNDLTSPLAHPSKYWKAYRLKARIGDVRIHDLRHTAASIALMDGGLGIKEVSEMLGHSSVAMTERYLNVHKEKKRTISDKAATAILSVASLEPRSR